MSLTAEKGCITRSFVNVLFRPVQDVDVSKKIARLTNDPRTDHPYDPPKTIRIKITDPRHPAKTGTTHKSAGSGTQSTAAKSAAESVTLAPLKY